LRLGLFQPANVHAAIHCQFPAAARWFNLR